MTRERLANIVFASVFGLLAVWFVALGVFFLTQVAVGDVEAEHSHGTPRVWGAVAVFAGIAMLSAFTCKRFVARQVRLRFKVAVAVCTGALLGLFLLPPRAATDSMVASACLFMLAVAALAVDPRVLRKR